LPGWGEAPGEPQFRHGTANPFLTFQL